MRHRIGALAAGIGLASSALGGPGARAQSLPPQAPPRPGPDVLYAPLATAPQLTNSGGWAAAALMVAGADAYAGGEYLYQDYVYDSFGANSTDVPFAQPEPVPHSGDTSVGSQTGDLVYPTEAARFGNDAADLLELRARLVSGKVAYRVTLNTMLDPGVAAVAIGIDTGPGGADDWGHGIGSLGPLGLDHVIVAGGGGAALDGQPLPAGTWSVDAATNQIEIRTPLAPGGATWRHYAGAGLWDAAAGTFAAIREQPSATEPGGAHGTDPPPFFNVGFRFAEPVSRDAVACTGTRVASSFGCGHYSEHGQALALAARDISDLHSDIDFGKLAAGVDESHVPTSGFMTRLYASHLDLGEGAQVPRPMLLGKIQPYGVYVPATYDPEEPAPLHLQMHWLYGTYMQFAVGAPNIYQELGEQRGSIVLTPMGRGTDGWYHDEAEVDLFEAWADLAARYALEPDRTTIGGYSMGGYGTFFMASQYPDLFSRGFAVVPPSDESVPAGAIGATLEDDPVLAAVDDALGLASWGKLADNRNVLPILDNIRHVPLLMWNGSNDANVPLSGGLLVHRRLRDLRYEHELDFFLGYDHFAFMSTDRWGPGRAWLEAAGPVDRDPAHVTYRVMPEMDSPALGLIHDHAYWVSEIAVAGTARTGLVDGRSLASGAGDPRMEEVAGAGLDPSAHLRRGLIPMQVSAGTPANALEISLTDVASLALWPQRAGISASLPVIVRVTSSTPAVITFRGSFAPRELPVPAGESTHVLSL